MMVKIEKLQSFAWNGTMGFGFDNKPFVQHEYERQETKKWNSENWKRTQIFGRRGACARRPSSVRAIHHLLLLSRQTKTHRKSNWNYRKKKLLVNWLLRAHRGACSVPNISETHNCTRHHTAHIYSCLRKLHLILEEKWDESALNGHCATITY